MAQHIALAYDKAFCFYYEDNLDLLKKAGARITTFSPLSDSSIPEGTDVIYIGGGYPELYAGALSSNKLMLNAIHSWSMSGRPLYAECGGLMYLSKGTYDLDGCFHTMAHVFPFETAMKKRLTLGYREVRLLTDCILGKEGAVLRGHEFHYSEIKDSTKSTGCRDIQEVYSLKNRKGDNIYNEGYSFRNTLVSYVHIHFGSHPGIADAFTGLIISRGE
ncbi:MAG: hypothetical protein HZA08_03300 [Nitrospirae bacterium]|nr:hypothetical protein [Nitrospirota bacterium]